MSGIWKKMCTNCKGRLKKQTIGSNVLYYCPKCGGMTTANLIDEGISKFVYPS
jgi:predicted RNA-binding Zn-ribbon protein involved in translation (DUF1610 family)